MYLIILVFCLNLVASTLGVLNTILISKKIMKPVYAIMFVDAIVFTTGLKMVSNGDSFLFVIAYALGKVCGAFCANLIEEKMAFGFSEVVLYEKGKRAIDLADLLREEGYYVTTTKGYGSKGAPRFALTVSVSRKHLNELKNQLNVLGYSDSALYIRDVKSVSGKIKEMKGF